MSLKYFSNRANSAGPISCSFARLPAGGAMSIPGCGVDFRWPTGIFLPPAAEYARDIGLPVLEVPNIGEYHPYEGVSLVGGFSPVAPYPPEGTCPKSFLKTPATSSPHTPYNGIFVLCCLLPGLFQTIWHQMAPGEWTEVLGIMVLAQGSPGLQDIAIEEKANKRLYCVDEECQDKIMLWSKASGRAR
ncbi:hypothetical protein P171DRAFT_512539 [Karstenula rhodostoma CBS 690.94]|uniref:Uncharacterized protein n=1 Tax=Karstenula rhodostoma CBS 690.94 TaxID=1392251 RepID=A0A9P4PM65_9PLEO|nr:hypothetical protein P171DRAFT_512539 [Karstenula rhodostoma CBS 690.94]